MHTLSKFISTPSWLLVNAKEYIRPENQPYNDIFRSLALSL